MMRAIGYSRCSTNEQADSGLGLEVQAERILAYATHKGLVPDDVIVDAEFFNHLKRFLLANGHTSDPIAKLAIMCDCDGSGGVGPPA